MVTQEEMEKMSPEEISNLQKQNCIFCKIIKGEIPSKKVYEDDSVLAILDIRPATKGHVLIMPKEHHPILPLVPPETFKNMFRVSKLIASVIKKVNLVKGCNIFIANGGVAGQQSPHFLFHIIPRDKGDGLDVLTPVGNTSLIEEQTKIEASLKNNLTIMMNNHLKREGKVEEQTNVVEKPSEDVRKEQISKILDENKDVRDLLRRDPKGFEELIKQNENLTHIFEGVDLEKLSNKLKEIPEEETRSSEATGAQKSETSSAPKPVVFLGSDPLAQKNKVFAYFEEKPKAKELLIENIARFKELLKDKLEVQKIFEDVNLDMLSEKLKESEAMKNE